MKKILLFLFLILPISVFAWDSCNSDKVVIKSISKVDESGYVEENNAPITDGKIVSTDIKLYDVGDSITYNIKLKNDSDEDYSLDKIFTNSDNVKYEIISDNNKLLSKEEKEVQLKITYTKKVDDSMYKSGKYIENRELDMVITNSIKNPITSSVNKIIVILLIIVFLLISGLLIKRDIRNSSLLLLLLLFIPVFVKAECRYVIRINSNIELKKVIPNPCYESSGEGLIARMIDGYGKKYNDINEESEVYGYNSVENGYRVYLKNINSTEPITERICTSINGLPIVSMKDLFRGSKAISIDLSGFDTSNVTDMSGMFYNSQATSLDLSSFDTSNVTDMNGMFYNSQAATIDLSSFDTSNVTNMQTMFYNSQVRNLDLSSFDTSKVTSMREMFYESKATSINVSSFDTSNVTDMVYMFSNSQATTLNLSSFDTSKVTNMSSMFKGCLAATLDLSSFDTGNVTNMSNMFSESEATIINVSSFDTSKVTNMNGMFKSCKVTTPFDLSNFTSESLTNINWMFAYTSMPTLDISGFTITNETQKLFAFKDSTTTTVYVKSQEVLETLKRPVSDNYSWIPSTMNLVVKGN